MSRSNATLHGSTAIAVVLVLCTCSAVFGQARYDRGGARSRVVRAAHEEDDPAPRYRESSEDLDDRLYNESSRRASSSRVRRRSDFRDPDAASPRVAIHHNQRGPWIVTNGQYIPYDPAQQPVSEYGEPPCPPYYDNPPAYAPMQQYQTAPSFAPAQIYAPMQGSAPVVAAPGAYACPPCVPLVDPNCNDSMDFGLFDWCSDWFESSCLYYPNFWRNFTENSGIQAFKGAPDLGMNGNFGFYDSLNWATPAFEVLAIGYQLGAAIVFSDFEGRQGPLGATRQQYFVTTGFFRRGTNNLGFQGGAVIDYLHDDFYVNMNLIQVRAELSYLCRCGHELGVWTATNVLSDNDAAPAFVGAPSVTWWSINQYNAFYRHTFKNGGKARYWIGMTDQVNVTFGFDAVAPLAEKWALQASYNYMLPAAGETQPRYIRESFGLNIAIVFHWGKTKTPNACVDPYRPLFNVADNSTLFIRTNSPPPP